MNLDYFEYLQNKTQYSGNSGFDPVYISPYAFDFQQSLIEYTVLKGRSAIFADCGLGKSLIELAFAQNIVEKTNGNVLLLTPIAVGIQMEKEAIKFGIEAHRSRDGKIKGKITITNYEQLHYFNPSDFEGVICDESSVLKNFNGKYKQDITIFMRKIKYRLLATATAAPNDFIELGTSSEALGYLGHMDMLNKFFKNDMNNSSTGNYRGEQVKWRLKHHAHTQFWKWVTSWARAIRKPSDLGFSDQDYTLPTLNEIDDILPVFRSYEDKFALGTPAKGLKEERDERKETIIPRCEKVAEKISGRDDFSVVWCNLNEEGDLLERIIPGAVQVSGKDSDERKEMKLTAFSDGQIKTLIIKPKIGAFGLNWQHCNYMAIFPTHSYEQYYQAVRRCWRFGQKREVTVDCIYSEGSQGILENFKRKHRQAEEMFVQLVSEMNNSLALQSQNNFTKTQENPKWL